MTREEAIECAKKMTYREAIRNTIYAKGVRYKKATRIKLHELAEIADKLVLCKDCIHRQTYKCPMYHEEWHTIDEGDGFFGDDWVVYDYTVDDGYCHLGDTEKGESHEML